MDNTEKAIEVFDKLFNEICLNRFSLNLGNYKNIFNDIKNKLNPGNEYVKINNNKFKGIYLQIGDSNDNIIPLAKTWTELKNKNDRPMPWNNFDDDWKDYYIIIKGIEAPSTNVILIHDNGDFKLDVDNNGLNFSAWTLSAEDDLKIRVKTYFDKYISNISNIDNEDFK